MGVQEMTMGAFHVDAGEVRMSEKAIKAFWPLLYAMVSHWNPQISFGQIYLGHIVDILSVRRL